MKEETKEHRRKPTKAWQEQVVFTNCSSPLYITSNPIGELFQMRQLTICLLDGASYILLPYGTYPALQTDM